ncbi:MAG TPA: hypothetical protein VLM91_08455 [Candidatus Methylomirabilis sp.]|nr:hypothetical protein [Candidatus Methylomirabilis sp.]
MRQAVWVIFFVVALAGVAIPGGESLAASSDSSGLTQQVAGGGVTVTATLLKDQGKGTAIKLALNTHSVGLDDYKLETLAMLSDETGKTYPVTAVEQAGGGGHHRQLVLRFGKLEPHAKTIELIVKDVAGVKERIFRWSTAE